MTSSLIWTLFAAGPFFGVLPLGDSKTEDDLVVIYTWNQQHKDFFS